MNHKFASSPLSPTGRLPSVPEMQRFPSVSGRISFSRVTPHQRGILESMVGDTLDVHGRIFTRSELLAVFNLHQIPKDPKICEYLGVSFAAADYSSLEKRILAHTEPQDASVYRAN